MSEDFDHAFEMRLRDCIPEMRHQSVMLKGRLDQDLVQEVCLRAWKSRHTFNLATEMLSWLNIIMRNLIRENYRGLAAAAERNTDSVEVFMEAMEVFEGSSHVPSDFEQAITSPAAQEHHVTLLRTIERMRRMNPLHMAALHCVVDEGMTYQEASRELGVPPDILKSQVCRARKWLKQ